MRRLTVKRGKTFVGCAAKIHIYIEDASGDLEINKVLCKKLGELKNGTEATFEIEDSALRVFAIADKLSKDYCFDCYQLSEGEEDVTLSGKCKLNPAAGNAFRFDGNDTVVAAADRRSSTKRGLVVFIAALLVGLVIGYGVTTLVLNIRNTKEKTFYVGDMQITLTEGFTQQSAAGAIAAFGSKKVGVFVSKEYFDSTGTPLSEDEYAELVISVNGFTNCEVKRDGELIYFIAGQLNSKGVKLLHYTYVYKSDDAFWLVQFAVKENDATKQEENIRRWAGSVSFN